MTSAELKDEVRRVNADTRLMIIGARGLEVGKEVRFAGNTHIWRIEQITNGGLIKLERQAGLGVLHSNRFEPAKLVPA